MKKRRRQREIRLSPRSSRRQSVTASVRPPRSSRGEQRVVNAAAGEREARFEVVGLEVRHLVENLCGVEAIGEKVEHVADSDAHAADTRAPATLFRVERDAIEKPDHEPRLRGTLLRARRERLACRLNSHRLLEFLPRSRTDDAWRVPPLAPFWRCCAGVMRVVVLVTTHAGALPRRWGLGERKGRRRPGGFFEAKIRPLLVERCYECHGEKKQKGGLRLDSKAGWQKGGDNGAASSRAIPRRACSSRRCAMATRICRCRRSASSRRRKSRRWSNG